MNWIDMSDRDKLFNYAKKFGSNSFPSEVQINSYFTSCDGNTPDIMEYAIEHYGDMKKHLTHIWTGSGFQEADLLATIVSATAMKNMPIKPEPKNAAVSSSEPIKKERYESIKSNALPTFVYEF